MQRLEVPGADDGAGSSAGAVMVKVSEADLDDRLAALRALRAKLAHEVDRCESREIAQLARQLREVLKEIAELEKLKPEESILDDFTARRKARLAASQGERAAGGSEV